VGSCGQRTHQTHAGIINEGSRPHGKPMQQGRRRPHVARTRRAPQQGAPARTKPLAAAAARYAGARRVVANTTEPVTQGASGAL
jgi:hypothetical protein